MSIQQQIADALIDVPDIVGVGIADDGYPVILMSKDNPYSRSAVAQYMDDEPYYIQITGEFRAQ